MLFISFIFILNFLLEFDSQCKEYSEVYILSRSVSVELYQNGVTYLSMCAMTHKHLTQVNVPPFPSPEKSYSFPSYISLLEKIFLEDNCLCSKIALTGASQTNSTSKNYQGLLILQYNQVKLISFSDTWRYTLLYHLLHVNYSKNNWERFSR